MKNEESVNKLYNEIKLNNEKISKEIASKLADKKMIISSLIFFISYFIILIPICKNITVDKAFCIYKINVNADLIAYLLLSVSSLVPISLFELSFYKSIRKSDKVIDSLNNTNDYLKKELDKIENMEKEINYNNIKNKVDIYYNCCMQEKKYMKLYKKGRLNKKLHKKYNYDEIKFVDEYIEEHCNIKVKQIKK